MLAVFDFNETATCKRYLNMLQNNLIPRFHLFGDGRTTWFLQDGAPTHCTTILRNRLHKNFEIWIGRRGTVEWSYRSPGINQMEFHFWSLNEETANSTKIRDLDHLQSRNIDVCRKTDGDADILNRFYNDSEFCIGLCIAGSGEHIERIKNLQLE